MSIEATVDFNTEVVEQYKDILLGVPGRTPDDRYTNQSGGVGCDRNGGSLGSHDTQKGKIPMKTECHNPFGRTFN